MGSGVSPVDERRGHSGPRPEFWSFSSIDLRDFLWVEDRDLTPSSRVELLGLWTIGIIVLVVGIILAILGAVGRPQGGRRHDY